MPDTLRILIVDDHPICIDALEVAARQAIAQVSVDHASSLAQMVARLLAHRYDAVFLDLALPDAQGTDVLKSARSVQPETAAAIVSSRLDASLVRAAMAEGARAFLPKSLPVKELSSAIAVVLHGGVYFPDHILATLADANGAQDNPLSGLSKTQLRVLEVAATGLSNKAIGEQLGIALPTVKTHLSEVFRILNVKNRSEAILEFQRRA